MLSKKQKDQVIENFKTHKSDTGSPQVQIALLTAEIKDLTKHLKDHKKDFSSRRGLLRKVSQRRRLLRYLERDNAQSFEDLVKRLKLKIAKRFEKKEISVDEILPEEPIAAVVADEVVETEQ